MHVAIMHADDAVTEGIRYSWMCKNLFGMETQSSYMCDGWHVRLTVLENYITTQIPNREHLSHANAAVEIWLQHTQLLIGILQ